MGTMPFHLEKGMMGLRLDYLTRSKKLRDSIYVRLMAGEDPFHRQEGRLRQEARQAAGCGPQQAGSPRAPIWRRILQGPGASDARK
jgi:hypothetical protein